MHYLILSTLVGSKSDFFSDNKTECRICKNVGHLFYRCPQKTEFPPKMCSRCQSTLHKTRECTNEIVCNYCSESGHKQNDCAEHNLMIAKQTYGEYADEILEGRELATENTIESLTEQDASTPVKTDEFHMSRTNLQFQDESETINVDDITDNKTDETVEIETKQTDIEENTTFK